MEDAQPAPFLSNFYRRWTISHRVHWCFHIDDDSRICFQGSGNHGCCGRRDGKTRNKAFEGDSKHRNTCAAISMYWQSLFYRPSYLWKEVGVLESPFVTVFEMVGIPYAADIMNFVILTAVLSVGNTGLFACTRILFSLSQNGMAHSSFGKLNRRNVPLWLERLTSRHGLYLAVAAY